ncbi:hypothetical protein H310_06331 [Aphanomyces invadans]|uniref:Uncharacterized protein n=1 Tax=Aphanomyces invadans TaxID=157072 RepID=A0A024U670_9STRA|nr:hypothetical protein H310_06331 [Aphanomyces invadans]ETW01725.1 hypothetical protein H310_06331 [Aphanomyces invadans]|eukprot:XP_008869573.1 hypothetical protein H310_06331 [Aphanomyces invadans]
MKYEGEETVLFDRGYGLSKVLPWLVQSLGPWVQVSGGGVGPAGNNDDISGRDWLYVEELSGVFYTTPRLRLECIVVDQPQHRLWCAKSKDSMQLDNISFVIPVEDASTHPSWKVVVQDPRQYQEWVICFPERTKMLQWVDLLRRVMDVTGCRGVVRDCVRLTTPNN